MKPSSHSFPCSLGDKVGIQPKAVEGEETASPTFTGAVDQLIVDGDTERRVAVVDSEGDRKVVPADQIVDAK